MRTRSFGRAVAGRFSMLKRDERGSVIVLVAVSMVAFLGMLALALDVGSWYQTQSHTQGTASAAALAAANYMAGGDSSSDATQRAVTYAGYNGLTITTANVAIDTTADTVTVTVPTTAPSYFAQVLGFGSRSVSAKAVASWQTTSTACTTPGNTCAAIWASDTNCTAGNYAVIFNGSGDTVTGGVHSNGGIDLIGGSQTLGPTTYGNGSGCAMTTGGSGDTYTSGPTAEAPITTWPVDYSTILTACGGTGQVACTGPGGTPSYCTQAQASFDFPTDAIATGNVYCAYGTGNVKNPSTWNGLIFFHSGSFGSSSSPLQGTWIGGTIDVGRKSYLSTQTTTPTYPLFYAVGSGTCSSASVGGVCMTAS
ncbi:MAG TPA: pilus assembly protein TadG-related protein, partial [Solirubrobacteraceae bacterium]|nr:pilus assembly protein TadG-related protein [Solirubrobacteraceae bacterium]